MKQALILGGYGNFGARIATALVKRGIAVIIAGRDAVKAKACADRLNTANHQPMATAVAFDANIELTHYLQLLQPTVVINTAGPFQTANYTIPTQCLEHRIHYIDLADGRDFVNGITRLDALAKKNQVIAISGASTVPCLSSAVIDHFRPQFLQINSLLYGITPGQKATRGLATTEGILTYLGKPLRPAISGGKTRYGWQDIYRENYPELGKRWMANCDIPDLDLFPTRYGLEDIQFSAGMESGFLHLGIWIVSWLVRIGLPLNLPKHARTLLSFSHYFDWLGTEDGGMHIIIKGIDTTGKPLEIKWYLIAKAGDGPQIPCIPAILLAEKIIRGELTQRGAFPCVGLLTLSEYLHALQPFAIKQYN